MLASQEGHTQVLQLLLEKGADREMMTKVLFQPPPKSTSLSTFFASTAQVTFNFIFNFLCSVTSYLPICLLSSRRFVCKQDGKTALSFAAEGAFERALAAGSDVDQRFAACQNANQYIASLLNSSFYIVVSNIYKLIFPHKAGNAVPTA